MNRLMLSTVALLIGGALVFGQEGQRPRPPRPDGEGGERPEGPPPGGGARGGNFGGGGGFGGAGGFGPGGGPGPMRPEMAKLDQLRNYIDVVDRFARMTRDPAAAAVAAVVSASDILRQRDKGPDAAIEYFNKTLPDVKNEAVQRAIRIQLIDLYKASNQADKALEQLDLLIKSAPAGSVPASQ
jgi:hypothetical protein